MPNKQHRFDPMPPVATETALDSAIRPFVDRLVREDKRERARAHFLPKLEKASYHELVTSIDMARARPYAPEVLDGWKGVRGVFLVDHDAYSLAIEEAMALYLREDAIFIAYGANFAVVRYQTGQPLLVT